MRAEPLKLATLFLAIIILLTITLTRAVISLPETFFEQPYGPGPNLVFRVPVALGMILTLALLVYTLIRQRRIRYIFGTTQKRSSWRSYLTWLLLFLAAYFILRSEKSPRVFFNNTSIIVIPPMEEAGETPVSTSNLTSIELVPAKGLGPFASMLPLLAVAILIILYFSSERIVQMISPGRAEPSSWLGFVEVRGDPKEAIIRIYRNAVVFLTKKGFPYRESWTHREHHLHVSQELGNLSSNLYSLVSLFEIAKYSGREVHEMDVSRAIKCYEELVRGVELERSHRS